MSTINGKTYSDVRNLNLRGGARGTGLLRWTPPQSGVPALWSSNPFSSDDYGLYLNTSGQLVFSSLGTPTVLGASGGGGGTPTWEAIFALDDTFSKTTVWTINNSSGDNQVLKLTNVGAGSGDVLVIDNGGTGLDIVGTNTSWSVTKLGAATFLSVATATVNSGTNLTLSATGGGLITIGANSNTITIAKATTFSSTITVTDGLTDLISTSNTAAALRITNNTATTWGAAASSAGVAVIRSTSLTTGSLLRLQLTEATLTTGNYLDCYDVTGAGIVFEIGEAGATTIGGVGAATVFTITAGDAVMSDGSLAITDADNANSFSVTNNTATSVSVIEIAGSGVFTGTTTSSFFEITQSGLTTGTLLRLAAAAATSSVGVVDIAVVGLTSGSALRITSSTANFTTGGKMIELEMVAATAGNGLTITTTGAYTGTGMVLVTAGAATTGVMISVVSTTGLTSGSLIRATSSTAGAIATNGAISFVSTGNFSSAAIGVGYVSIQAASTTAGTILSLTGGALTTGVALYVADTTTGMTSGSLIRATSGTTGSVATSGVYSFLATGAYTSGASTVGMFHVAGAATVSGTIMSILGGAQTTGIALNITDPSAGMTSGSLLRVITATTGAVATNGIASLQASGNYTSTSNAGLLTLVANSTTAGTIQSIFGNALTTGVALILSGTGVYTGTGFFTITQSGATTGVVAQITTAGLTTGSALAITSAALTTGQGILVTDSSTDTGAHAAIFAKITSTAATAAAPIKTSNVAVNNSKFTKIMVSTDGTKTFTLWLSQDATSPNTVLSGIVGDICVNGPSGRSFYCTGTTNWTASNA